MKRRIYTLVLLFAVPFLIDCSNNSSSSDTYKFTFNGTNCSINGEEHYQHDHYNKETNIQYTIVPNEGFVLPYRIDNPDIIYDRVSGVITINEIKKDITITAEALPNTFTVTFDANGGTLESEAKEEISVNADTQFKDIEGIGAQSATYNPDYFDFAGWALSRDSQVTIDDNYLIVSNITVYAIFTPKAYATLEFSTASRNCRLFYGEKECVMGESLTIPANVNITLDIIPIDNYFPVFEDKIEVDGEQQYEFHPYLEQVIVKVASGDTCVITATTDPIRENLNSYSWDEISEISTFGIAPLVFNIGDEKIVYVNNQPHRVRIIGFNHDILSSSGDLPTYAGTTFEFANLISDASGYSLTTPWNWEDGDDSTNKSYLDSNLRKAIDGGISAKTHLCWFRKNGVLQTEDAAYKGKSVLDMLPTDLKEVLKEVKKSYAKYDDSAFDSVDTYNTKLFPLSYSEMSETTSEHALQEGYVYEFYQKSGADENNSRIKWQTNHHNHALIDDGDIPTIKESWKPQNFAGFNSNISEEYGGNMWLRSPSIRNTSNAWRVNYDGEFTNLNFVYGSTIGVAPAFCV